MSKGGEIMLFKEMGKAENPTIILVHGSSLSWWQWKDVSEILSRDYHVVMPIIDGHGEDGNENFISIEDSAKKLIKYIDDNLGGHVLAISGLSIGGQIVTEIVSRRSTITDFALIESAVVQPTKAIPTAKLTLGLVKEKWFAKIQAKSLNVPDIMFDEYYNDSLKITKDSLANIANVNYKLKREFSETKAKVLILIGEKDNKAVKDSSKVFFETLSGCKVFTAPQMGQGELSMNYPSRYVQVLTDLINE